MMKGVKKYGVCIPFVPADPFLIVWDLTYKCKTKGACSKSVGEGEADF